MSVNVQNSGDLTNIESKFPKQFAQFNTSEFELDNTTKVLSLKSDLKSDIDKIPTLESDVSEITTKLSNIDTLETKADSISNPNLLDNSFFNINTSGLTSQTGGYFIDRWRVFGGKVETDNNGLKFSLNGGTFALMCQTIEDKAQDGMNGKVVTASILLSNGTVVSGSTTFTKGVYNAFCSKDGYLLDFDASSGVGFRIYTENDGVIIRGVKLEVGSTSTIKNDTINNGGFTNGYISKELSYKSFELNALGGSITSQKCITNGIVTKINVRFVLSDTNKTNEAGQSRDGIMSLPSNVPKPNDNTFAVCISGTCIGVCWVKNDGNISFRQMTSGAFNDLTVSFVY